MTVSDAIHDNMMNLIDELVEWHADRLQNDRYRNTILKVLATMHNAIIELDGFGNHISIEESLKVMTKILTESIIPRSN